MVTICNLLSCLFLRVGIVQATEFNPNARPAYGLTGYGIPMYDPPCATACSLSILAPLNCTDAQMEPMTKQSMKQKRMDVYDDPSSGSIEGDHG